MRFPVASVVLLALLACTAVRPLPPSTSVRGNILQVTNDNWLDVVVYVLYGGTRIRIGEAIGHGVATLRIPPAAALSGMEILVVSKVTSESYRTDEFHVFPGAWVDLRIESALVMSNYAVWQQ